VTRDVLPLRSRALDVNDTHTAATFYTRAQLRVLVLLTQRRLSIERLFVSIRCLDSSVVVTFRRLVAAARFGEEIIGPSWARLATPSATPFHYAAPDLIRIIRPRALTATVLLSCGSVGRCGRVRTIFHTYYLPPIPVLPRLLLADCAIAAARRSHALSPPQNRYNIMPRRYYVAFSPTRSCLPALIAARTSLSVSMPRTQAFRRRCGSRGG